MKKMISSLLIIQMVSSGAVYAAPANPENFGKLLKTYRAQLELTSQDKSVVLKEFSEALVTKKISVEDVDAYVKSQLTEKEYAAYKSKLAVSMKNIDASKLSSKEFAQVVSGALEATQAKGLTWSSCGARVAGIVVAVASVVVGIIAIAKKKLDHVTEQALYDAYVSKRNGIDGQYRDTTNKLNDPQGYFNNKINNAQNSINSKRDSVSYYRGKIDHANDRIDDIDYMLAYYDLTESEIDSLYYERDQLVRDTQSWTNTISSLYNDIQSLQNNITFYQNEKTRYMDPKVVAAERASLEKWYPEALKTAEADYQVSLKNLPGTNSEIDRRNSDIQKTKKTLGIIAGAGGAVSLGLILSNTNATCN